MPYEGRKKASFWLAGSYDPALKLLYWTTGSAYPYPEILKGTGGGAVLYTNSLLALDAETGTIKWFFQMQPRDNFDMDHQDNPILADVTVGGVTRRMVYTLGKPGVLWAFDRETGKHLWNRLLVTHQNVYRHIDPMTGSKDFFSQRAQKILKKLLTVTACGFSVSSISRSRKSSRL